MAKKTKEELAARLAWPGIAHTEAEITKSTLPRKQADELRGLIAAAREQFEMAERLCRAIAVPLFDEAAP
jgi:hypothetical protein